uniref:uncharacterized protein LOC104266141 isoform X5 n=1 Tax=Ciona intestinalis TaxID=7719 RepID=UPI00089DC64A|nr:uncharacterized protein LOC104266141 isoform X5 [Ciona intestinalis]|eukprot:XP_018669239.1 uncharacterized protein LOC104266141 isoform X5 [Ciona intestinalis]
MLQTQVKKVTALTLKATQQQLQYKPVAPSCALCSLDRTQLRKIDPRNSALPVFLTLQRSPNLPIKIAPQLTHQAQPHLQLERQKKDF